MRRQCAFPVFDELVEAGYTYDSSVFPVQHDFYGIADWPRFPFSLCKHEDGEWAPACIDDPGCQITASLVERGPKRRIPPNREISGLMPGLSRKYIDSDDKKGNP